MFDQLINMGRQELGQPLKQQANLNDDQLDQTFNVAQNSFMNGVKDQALSGNLSQLTSLFNGNMNNSSMLNQSVMSNMIPQLTNQLGVSQDKAGSIAGMLVPFLIAKFASNETGTANNGNDLMNMMGLGGGNMLSGLGNKLGDLF
ncbi:MAG: hypothetical protein K2X86_03125 [Cytophagaceae bacterium]|nr:hypothetical protein [Cytophagaceae bacterium]